MTSIDAEFLKKDIVNLFPESKLKNLTFYSPQFQLRTKFEYLSGKMGVAQTANQLVDHVLNKGQEIGLKEYIGVGHRYDGAHGDSRDSALDNEFDIEGKYRIADSISAFLNAYVDIAKDPYVSRGNHNNFTSGVNFLLIRSGVPIEWVNRFIGQPILKELVELMKNAEGISSDKIRVGDSEVSPMDFLLNKYNIDPATEVSSSDVEYLYNKGKTKLEDAIKDNGADDSLQVDVLNAFRYLQTRAKEMNMSVQSSKTPDYGNFGQLLVANNKYLQVIEEGKVLGFREKFEGTMTGTYKRNGIDWVRSIAKKNKLFLSADDMLEGTANSISSRVGKGERITNEEMVKTISSGYYTYLMSGFKLFKSNRANINALFTEVPEQLNQLKKTSTNFLVQELEIRYSGGYDYLKINSKNKPPVYVDKIYRAWLELLRSTNPAEVKLGERLARYAYSQSGFQNNLNQFFTYIPHELMYAMGVDEYINNAHLTSDELAADVNFRDQLFRHNADDRSLVPRVSKVDTKKLTGTTHNGFIYMKENSKLITGKNEKELDTYPEFVSIAGAVDLIHEIEAPSSLYKLLGTIQVVVKNKQGLDEIKVQPTYVRTFKLGTKSNHGSILEYQRNNTLGSSTLAVNQFHPDAVKLQNEFEQAVLSNPTFIGASYLLDPAFEKTKVNESEDEIEDAKVEEKTPTLATGDMKNLLSMKSLPKEDWQEKDNICAMPLPSI